MTTIPAASVPGGDNSVMFKNLTDTERSRSVAAIVILILGLLLILWAWGSWVYRTSPLTTVGIQSPPPRWEDRLL